MKQLLVTVSVLFWALPAYAQTNITMPASLTCSDGFAIVFASGLPTCASTGGVGTVTNTTFTTGKIPKASGGAALVDSLLSESGAVVTTTGTHNATVGFTLNGTTQQNVASGQAPTFLGTNFTAMPATGVTGTAAVLNVANVFSAFGAHTFGSGGTGGTSAGLAINGPAASGVGPYIEFKANSVSKGYFGTHAAVAGGTAHDIVIGSVSGLGIESFPNNVIGVTISSAAGLRLHAYGAGTLVTDASGNVTASSDERLKDITGQFRVGLDAIMGLRPILHRWKPETGYDTENIYAGWSAQNVLQFVPEAVGVNLNGMYSVNDRPVLAATVNAVQELAIEIDELRKSMKLPPLSRGMSPVKNTDRAVKSATKARLAEEAKADADRKATKAECEKRNEKLIKDGGTSVVCGGGL